METRAHYVLIGSFALAVAAGAFLFILWLGPGGIDREFDTYDVIFNDAVTGLSEGGSVRFNGIVVGEVADLRLNPDNPTQVIARVRLEAGTPVKIDTVAQLELAGLTGLSFIQFTGGSIQSALLRDTDADVPQIVASPSEWQKILGGGGDIVASLNEAILAIDRLLSEENISNVEKTIENIMVVSEAVSSRSGEIDSTLGELSRLSTALGNAASNIERLSEVLAGEGDPDQRSLAEVINEAHGMLSSATNLIDDAQVALDETRGPMRDFSENGLAQASAAITEARGLINSLDQLVRAIERDPGRFLSGTPYPTYDGGGDE